MMSYQKCNASSERSKQSVSDVGGSVTAATVAATAGAIQSNESLRYVETTSLEKRSLLDPHLSVLELLERTCEKANKKDVKSDSILSAKNMNTSTNSISDSWQAIHRSDTFISVVPERCSSQATAAGILSSSDTSEEELDNLNSPNMSHQQQQIQQQPRSLTDFRPINLGVPLVLPEIGQPENHEDEDNETITKSLTSSSNSFIMPKLSLSQKSHKFRILILGRPGLKFYQSIPKRYQQYFELPRFHDPSEFKHFTGILVIFQELKEMVSLLNRVCQCTPTRPIIPICQTGQRQQVKNVLGSLLKSKLISLLYPPVVISNHSDLSNMFRFLQDLSKTISDNSDNDDDESVGDDTRMKKSYQRKKKRATSNEKSRPRKRTREERINRWILWGISLTVGVGVGYCMSYFVSSTWISVTTKSIDPLDSCTSNDNLLIFEDSSFNMGEFESDVDNPFTQAVSIFKQTLKQWNWAIKQFFNRHLPFVENLSSSNCNEWAVDDNANRILALGYILL